MRRGALVFPGAALARDAEALELIAVEAAHEIGREAQVVVAIGEVQRWRIGANVSSAPTSTQSPKLRRPSRTASFPTLFRRRPRPAGR